MHFHSFLYFPFVWLLASSSLSFFLNFSPSFATTRGRFRTLNLQTAQSRRWTLETVTDCNHETPAPRPLREWASCSRHQDAFALHWIRDEWPPCEEIAFIPRVFLSSPVPPTTGAECGQTSRGVSKFIKSAISRNAGWSCLINGYNVNRTTRNFRHMKQSRHTTSFTYSVVVAFS
jgi:hypothetical protein